MRDIDNAHDTKNKAKANRHQGKHRRCNEAFNTS
jgi:hypothetical protein